MQLSCNIHPFLLVMGWHPLVIWSGTISYMQARNYTQKRSLDDNKHFFFLLVFSFFFRGKLYIAPMSMSHEG